MTAGELFVNIKLAGAEAATKAIGGVKGALTDVGSTSLEAKAAVLGVVYALEQMMSGAAQTGTALSLFGASTGISTTELQKWQYAARQVGVQAEDITASFKGVQSAMQAMIYNHKAPEGMAILFKNIGFDPTRARDTVYVMNKLMEASKTLQPEVFAKFAKSFGLTENAIAFMIKNKVDIAGVKDSMVMSDREIEQLNRVDAAWANLWNTTKLMAAAGTAKFGLPVVGEISKSLKFLNTLYGAMQKVIGVGPTMGAVMAGIGVAMWAAFGPIAPIIAGLVIVFAELQKVIEGKDNAFSRFGKFLEDHGMAVGPGKGEGLSGYGGGDPMAAFGGSLQMAGAPSTTNNNISLYANTQNPQDHARIVSDALEKRQNAAIRQNKSTAVRK